MLDVALCVQRFGTGAVGPAFAPILLVWLLSIAGIGLYNAFVFHPGVWAAVWPGYGVAFFARQAGHSSCDNVDESMWGSAPGCAAGTAGRAGKCWEASCCASLAQRPCLQVALLL